MRMHLVRFAPLVAARPLNPFGNMMRPGFFLLAFWLAAWSAEAAGDRWPGWLERAPLNTDVQFVDPSLQWGLARACRWLAFLVNLPVLAGLVYAFERARADFSYFIYVFFGILVGSFLLSAVLSPFIGVFSVAPIIAFETFLLARFCLASLRSAFLVAVLYHAFQIGYIFAYRAIASAYS
jgi:hypothetical protein